jgi:hypothetical protein
VRDVTYGPDVNGRLAADLRIVVTVIVVPFFVFCSSVAKGVGRGGKVDK